MNTKEILGMLTQLFSGFVLHKEFLKEIRNLLSKELKGKENAFFKSLTTQLNNIKTFGRMVYRVDNNEILKGADGHYYSIHIESKQFNIRLLIYIDDNGIPYFLCCFYERAGKRKTDYTAHTKVMKARLAQLLEGDANE